MVETPRNNPDQEQPQLSALETPEAQAEVELTPEVLEKIMAKVQDIDGHGIGYSMIGRREGYTKEYLSRVLADGLLGATIKGKNATYDVPTREKWVKNARQKKDAAIFFNITGRSDEKSSHREYCPTEISASCYIWGGRDNIGILFDISSFEEDEPGENKCGKGGREMEQKSGRYRADALVMNVEKYKKWKEKDFYPSPDHAVDTEYGYILSHRIAPRFFTGILINPKTKVSGPIGTESKKRDRQELVELARKIATGMLEVDKDKPDLLVPIYDTDGNLLWPKQIDYKDMRKFVTERDKKKQSEE